MQPLKICYVSTEVIPFARKSNLADVAGTLPIALKELNQDIRLMMSKYKSINERKFVLREVIRLKEVPVEIGGQTLIADGKTAFLPNSKVHVYFMRIPEYFDRKEFYFDPKTGEGFEDNAERFAAFSKSVLETLKLLYWQPDIIHCNNWQTALIPFYLKTQYADDDFFQSTKTVFTIHDLSYPASFPLEKADKIDVAEKYIQPGAELELNGRINYLKAGLLFADQVNTVSPQFAEELASDPTLAGTIQSGKIQLHGILNGVDYSEWNPETDSILQATYSAEDIDPKYTNKEFIFRQMELPCDADRPLIGMIADLTESKGWDLFGEAAEQLLALNAQFVVLGTGEAKYQNMLKKLIKKYPDKLAVQFRSDNKMAHSIIGGADMLLSPARQEPCEMYQMCALRYGTVPVVRKTGGLADVVNDATGFTFSDYTADALIATLEKALDTWGHRDVWRKIQKAGMQEDFSWEKSAQHYMDLYRAALEK